MFYTVILGEISLRGKVGRYTPRFKFRSASRGGDYRLPENTRSLAEAKVPKLCNKDVAKIEKHFETVAADRKTHITFLPTWPQINWHFMKAGYMALEMCNRDIFSHGAVLDHGKAWIYWYHDVAEKKLKVLRIVTHESLNREDDIASLLLAALAEAADWEFESVLVWNPDEDVRLAARKVHDTVNIRLKFDERLDSSIPSFRWRGDGQEETVWEFNEYAFCC